MTRKELCEMCMEYSVNQKCERQETCKLQKILTENQRLREENKKLREKAEKLESARRWDDFPDMMGK